MKIGSDVNETKKLLRKNTIASLIFQVTTVVCGFIIPRLILSNYGSTVNGLVSSIKQFLGIISFLELGVGAVVQSALYKPIVEKNIKKINEIVTSANKFFSKIAIIIAVYIIVLLFVYPSFINTNFNFWYTFILIVAISISFFSQFYFGIVDRLFLNSAQHSYIQFNAQTITLILNTIVCFFLINLNCSIQVVQLSSALVFLIRPLFLKLYVNAKYHIDRHASYEDEPIKEKWNGIAQHLASVILSDTDIIVLTIFATLGDVSIYSIYYMVTNGVRLICYSLTSGIETLEGKLWAENNKSFTKTYQKYEWLIHTITVLLFVCTGLLIIPFVKIYTTGVEDINYIQPIFAYILTIATCLICLRLPYSIMILVSSRYKETRYIFFISAALNLIISIIFVNVYGLVGVAIGTFLALLVQVVSLSIYVSKKILPGTGLTTCKLFFTDIIQAIIIIFIVYFIRIEIIDFFDWLLFGIIVFAISVIVISLFNIIIYSSNIKQFKTDYKKKGELNDEK